MQYTSILTITAAFRLAIAAAIPRYSSTSTTMDETIAMIAPTIFETKTVTATVTAFKKLTIAAHKLAIEHSSFDPGVVELVDTARRAAWASSDAAEGRAAFLEKRTAVFTGR